MVRILVAVLVALLGTAHADRVGVMPLSMTGDAAPDLAPTLEASFVGGLATAGLTVVPPSEIRTGHPRFTDCRTEGCAAALRSLLRVEWLARPAIEAVGKTNFVVHAEALGPRGSAIARVEERCEVCTVKEAHEAASRAGAALASRVAAATSVAPAAPPRSRAWLGWGVATTLVGLACAGAGAALIAIDGSEASHGVGDDRYYVVEEHETLLAGVGLTVAGGVLVSLVAGPLFWRHRQPR